MQYWQPSQVISPEGRKFSLLVQKWLKKTLCSSKKVFSSKCSHGHVKCSFYNPAKNILPESRKVSFQFLKVSKNQSFFKTNVFPQSVSLDTCYELLRTLSQTISTKSRNLFVHYPKMIKNYYFLKFLLLKMYNYSQGKQFWQPCSKNSHKFSKIFRSMSVFSKAYFFSQT